MKTVNIRVGVVVDSDGNWNATGWSSSGDQDKQDREFLGNAGEFLETGFPLFKELILTASIEIPDTCVEEIPAKIISPENKQAD